VALVYLVIQLIEGNILVPMVMRNTIGISPFLVLTSLLVGAALGGIPGALVAVPVVAAIEVVLERLQARDEPVAQDPTSVAEPDLETRKRERASVAQSVRRALGR
jgi:predicted PurR-regulated permease PerM